jgi:hypothetical protein
MNKESASVCRQKMFDHLKTKGYPDMEDQAIINEIPEMHRQLLDEKLIPSTFTVDIMMQIAIAARQNIRLMEQMQAQMQGQFKSFWQSGI